jgi:hypothetical protein
VEVEPWALPAGNGTEVGGKPTTAADADAGAAVEVDRWSRGGTPSGTSGRAFSNGAATAYLFLVSLWAWIASSAIITLLTNSGNVPPVLSAMRSGSLVERPIMKWSFFLSSVSTWSGAYYARWLNCLE